VFHASLLTCYQKTEAHRRNFTRLPAELLDGEKEFEVEAIQAHRKQGHGLQFLIKWKGYLTSDNLWEPQKNLKYAQHLLTTYKTEHQL
jgi:hypothetical protein